MKAPKKANIAEIIAVLDKDASIYEELAPIENGKPLMGIRTYPRSFTDSEWIAILESLKRDQKITASKK